MKKKLCLLLLVCLILPVVALFGCGRTNYYNFSFMKSGDGTCDGGNSFVNGSGTFAEGDTITLVATPDPGAEFLGFVYRKTNLIVDGEGGYKVTISENGTGVLQFSSSQSREGQYTAVFSAIDKTTGENLVDYVKFEQFKFEKKGEDDPLDEVLFNLTHLDVYQGTSAALEYSFNFETDGNAGLSVKASEVYNVEDYSNVNKVLLLTAYNPQSTSTTPKSASAKIRIGDNEEKSLNSIKIYSRENTENVTYSNGVYEVRFGFTSGGNSYNLVLIYKILSRN